MMPPKQADMAIRGYPCLAMVMSEKQSDKEINRFYSPCVCATGFAMQNTCITSDAVAPGQKGEAQHGVTDTEHHAQHVQDADHLGGCCTDQHGTGHEA